MGIVLEDWIESRLGPTWSGIGKVVHSRMKYIVNWVLKPMNITGGHHHAWQNHDKWCITKMRCAGFSCVRLKQTS